MTDGTRLDCIIEAVRPFVVGTTPGRALDAVESLQGRYLSRAERLYVIDELSLESSMRNG